MFFQLIENKRNEWLAKADCPIRELMTYIISKGCMRDAQIEAIKTYLYLKIACGNQPLPTLFSKGTFNAANLDELEISRSLRDKFSANPAALALYEYSSLKDTKGDIVSEGLRNEIKSNYESINFSQCISRLFYGVDYPDYIFSLPMGAGKTYLMAAFIYLDLYFAVNEPDNPLFSHNFLVLIPSGLKSSIIDSLREIREFDPSWIIPEPTASQLKRLIKFEVLDELKTGNKSNQVRNPNAQKINIHRPFESLMGLVAIINAEKIIFDGVDKLEQDSSLFSKEELAKTKLANELRKLLGSMPNLSLLIDEVHHATDDDLKLRKVIKSWLKQGNIKNLLGFSGTPNLKSAEKIKITDTFSIRNKQLSNVVTHYPLIKAIGNFLKTPTVKLIDEEDSDETVLERGVKEFLETFGETVYETGCCAKLAIYCGTIETLEHVIYPVVATIASEHGYNPSDVILKFHRGNKDFPAPADAELQFKSLDLPFSKIKIILLVQIGKEGWNCKSLTSVILPHKQACPTNMVLQTSCRCLRQVVKHAYEPALIWLNKSNAKILNAQLQKQQNITLQEFNSKHGSDLTEIKRYSRMDKVNLPEISFYQLHVEYAAEVLTEAISVEERLSAEDIIVSKGAAVEIAQDMSANILGYQQVDEGSHTYLPFNQWLLLIAKEGFNYPSFQDLNSYRAQLLAIYNRIADGVHSLLRPQYDHEAIRRNIRLCFHDKRTLSIKEDIVKKEASLLHVEKLASPIYVADTHLFTPTQTEVDRIIELDEKAPAALTPELIKAMELLRANGMSVQENPEQDFKDRTYHYLPYHFDSSFEQKFFLESALPIIKENGLEVYYNGDRDLTSFKIRCYERKNRAWTYLGHYTPDFLLLSRNDTGEINRICIIETKGKVFADKFRGKKDFMQSEFLRINKEKFGYPRFDFLYLEDTMQDEQQRRKVLSKIRDFFQIQ